MVTEPLLTLPEVAALLSVSRRQVERWIADGRLRVVRLGKRATRVRPREVDAFVAACERQSRLR